mgnify:CR=1 FL=1
MPGTDADVIDALVGIIPGSPLSAIRARRPQARAHAQATYRALFAPEDGRCVGGPCSGASLSPWPISLVDGWIVTA